MDFGENESPTATFLVNFNCTKSEFQSHNLQHDFFPSYLTLIGPQAKGAAYCRPGQQPENEPGRPRVPAAPGQQGAQDVDGEAGGAQEQGAREEED